MSCRWRGWVSLNFLQLEPTRLPNETVHLQKEKWWHLHHKSKTLGGASVGRSCHCCHWKPSWCECPILQEAVRKFAAAPGAAPIAGRFSPGPSLTRSGSLPGATISGGYSCSQRPLTFTCPPLLCVTQTLPCAVWTSPFCATRELTQWVWGRGSSAPAWHHLLWTPIEGHIWFLLLQKSWRDWQRKAGGSWEGCDQGGISRWLDCSSSKVHCFLS